MVEQNGFEAETAGKLCEIDCVRSAWFGRFVAVEDGMWVVARSGRFHWPPSDTTAPQSEAAESRLAALCDRLRSDGWEQRGSGSGRAWYAHSFFPGDVPAEPGDEAPVDVALAGAPDLTGEREQEDSGEPVLNGHPVESAPDDELESTAPLEPLVPQAVAAAAEEQPEELSLAEAAAAVHASDDPQHAEPLVAPADDGAEYLDGLEPEPDEQAPAQPWYVAPRATHATLTANVVSNLCDRVTAYTSSAQH